MQQFVVNGLLWDLDPMEKFQNVDDWTMKNMIGLIPSFITTTTDNLVKEALRNYGFGGPEMGGTVNKEGIYSYPGDPDLFPIACCRLMNDKTIYIYEYAIVAFIGFNKKDVIYRFD